jgi:hypothetical protein
MPRDPLRFQPGYQVRFPAMLKKRMMNASHVGKDFALQWLLGYPVTEN